MPLDSQLSHLLEYVFLSDSLSPFSLFLILLPKLLIDSLADILKLLDLFGDFLLLLLIYLLELLLLGL